MINIHKIVGIGAAVDLEVSSEGAPFPSIEISAGVGIGAGVSLSLSYGYEVADCLNDDLVCSDEFTELPALPSPVRI